MMSFDIDSHAKRRVLITGRNSYIGTKLQEYAADRYPALLIDAISVRGDRWKEIDFSSYDTVVHLAGIAHSDTGKISAKQEADYYRVNTELTLEIAKQAKLAGVKQFIFASSMIIYGESKLLEDKIIYDETDPQPVNAYGDSKLKADLYLQDMADTDFKTAILRLPMVYGQGCKGNFRTLVKMAELVPVFPYVRNRRSMIYIDNLCEFICQLICSGEGGIFFPQNTEYVNTTELIKEIGQVNGRHIYTTAVLAPFVYLACKVPGKIGRMVNKAFGSMVYDAGLSKYDGMDYQLIGFKESLQWLRQSDQ